MIPTGEHGRAAETGQLEEFWHCVTLVGLQMLDTDLGPACAVDVLSLVRTREPVGEEIAAVERSVSKSAVSRTFVART